MTRDNERAALLERNRRMIASLRDFVPEGFDRNEKLFRVESIWPGRSGLSVAQGPLAYALALLETGGDAGTASDIVEKCLEYQDLRDPDSPTCGNFFWYTHWTEVTDPNAVSFMAPFFARMWDRHRDKLRPAAARSLEERFPLILNGLMKQPWVHWAYTNIFLLTTAGRLMVSRIVGDDAALKETVRQWEEWIDETGRFGIPEFNSPTYTAVDLFALLDVREAAPTEEFRGEAERALEYFFLEFFLHYHPKTELLTGAFSRAYPHPTIVDLRHRGGVELLCHHQLGSPIDLPNLSALHVAYSDYLAPRWIRDFARERPYPMTIDATSGWEKGYWVRRNFMQRKYAVGTFSNSFYSILQVPVFIAYDAAQERKTVYTRGEPELGTCYADQVEDSVLAAFCYNFADGRRRYGNIGPETRDAKLCLSLGTPDTVTEVLVDGAPWDGKTASFALPVRIVFGAGAVVVGVVPVIGSASIEPDGMTSDEKPVVLVADEREVRLELIVYRGKEPAETISPRQQAGFYLRVAESDDLIAFAARMSEVTLEGTFEEDAWRLSAVDGGRRLSVRAPLSAENVFADGPKVGANHPEPGWLLRSPPAELKLGEFAEIARGKRTWRRTPWE